MLDLKNSNTQQDAMEAFFFGYQAFTAKADEMLERRGLSRVHQRIVFFIGRYPDLSVKELLDRLGVSKQALNMPLWAWCRALPRQPTSANACCA